MNLKASIETRTSIHVYGDFDLSKIKQESFRIIASTILPAMVTLKKTLYETRDQILPVLSVDFQNQRVVLQTKPLNLSRRYTLQIGDEIRISIRPGAVLNQLCSVKPLGHHRDGNADNFAVFAPRAWQVDLILYEHYQDHQGRTISMTRDSDGVWETSLPENDTGKFYGYRVFGPDEEDEHFDPSIIIADPYSKAVVTQNHYLHPAKTLMNIPEFEWEGDTWIAPIMEDLIIYELHVRDITNHSSSGIPEALRGTYPGLAYSGAIGGLDHLLNLGINCIELMPIQEFGNLEIDYKNPDLDVYNDWNAYERNHWGYMTSYYFAPESYYATGQNNENGKYAGGSGRVINEVKHLVKALHAKGIAVIMDVVYNHVSHYDQNPLKYLDKSVYFRLDAQGKFLSESGCGNDLKTEHPMARRLILDSLIYWMTEYHMDGFRFDLATMIDSETLDEISSELRKINPDVILIAEPWGGGKYDLHSFSERGWGAWNDLFRNNIKGQNPFDGPGFIFNAWQGINSNATVKNHIMGSTQNGGGPFKKSGHAVNYLESHDDYSLGDFIRIATHEVDPTKPVQNRIGHVKLSERQIQLHRLAAFILLTSQGCVMLHAGQEFGRSKVIASTAAADSVAGFIDHNSYNKDDETNWINYDHMHLNQKLVDYYRGLIALRKEFFMLHNIPPDHVRFLETPDPFFITYHIFNVDRGNIVVIINASSKEYKNYRLPEGAWDVLADGNKAGIEPLFSVETGTLNVPAKGHFFLVKGSD